MEYRPAAVALATWASKAAVMVGLIVPSVGSKASQKMTCRTNLAPTAAMLLKSVCDQGTTWALKPRRFGTTTPLASTSWRPLVRRRDGNAAEASRLVVHVLVVPAVVLVGTVLPIV